MDYAPDIAVFFASFFLGWLFGFGILWPVKVYRYMRSGIYEAPPE